MNRPRAIRWVLWISCVGIASWPAVTWATPEFPAAVVQDLGLPGITIDPPNGCTLCHATDAGGTSLKPFGQLLQQYGVTPYDVGSLQQALSEVEQNEPQLIDDIRAGHDPSSDARASVHSPEYGCGVTGGAGRPRGRAHPRPPLEGRLFAVVATVLVAGAVRWRRKARAVVKSMRSVQ
jgi:hypothetical protein